MKKSNSTNSIRVACVLSALTLICLLTNSKANAQQYEWGKGIGGYGTNYGKSIAIDKSGNVYVAGFMNGTVDFDPSSTIANLVSSGKDDIFIAKYDAAGNYIWAKNMGGTYGESAQSLAIDSKGNLFISGFFSDVCDFDPSGATAWLTSKGQTDIFLAKYDSDGNYIWAKQMGGGSYEETKGLTIDANDNIFICGTYKASSTDIDPSAASVILPYFGNDDLFIAKYDNNGNYVWAHGLGSTGWEEANSIAIDQDNNLIVTGFYNSGSTSIDFDASPTTVATLISNGNNDIFIAKYDNDGKYIWAKGIGGAKNEEAYEIKTDVAGNIYFAGYFEGIVDFDPSAATAELTAKGNTDALLAKYDKNGKYIWARSIEGAANEEAFSIALDDTANVYLTGYFKGTVDFDPSSSSLIIPSKGTEDAFIAKYNTDGNLKWAFNIGVYFYYAQGHKILLDKNNDIYCIGMINGDKFDFDPSAGTALLTSDGLDDMFLAKYTQKTKTGLKEFTGFTTGISVYPNPSGDYITVLLNDTHPVNVYNTCGSLIATFNGKQELTLDISNYPSGQYILQAGSETTRFIKK